jgi:hypothetical protein
MIAPSDAQPAPGPVRPHQFVRFLTGPDATPQGTCHCGRDLFDPMHPDWPPAENDEDLT